MKTNRSLAKVFGPVLLLTASLALPMDMFAAPQGRGRAAAEEKADRNERQGKNRQERAQQRRGNQRQEQRRTEVRRPQQRRQVQERQQGARQQGARQRQVQEQRARERQQALRQQQVQEQRARERQQAAARQSRLEKQRAQERQQALRQQRIQAQQSQQRQLALQRQQAQERQRLQQRQAYDRQQAVARQQALERQRILEQQRRSRPYRYDRNRYDSGYYNTAPRQRVGGGGGADRSIFHIDGYLQGGRDCMLVRDHDGRIWSLVGNTYGLGDGEHVRLYGRIVDGGACGWEGTSFDIYEVRTVWADDRHRSTHYDHLYDGPFDSNDYRYEDDGYDDRYDDRYDGRDEDRSWLDRLFGG